VTGVAPLAGGTSSLTFLATLDNAAADEERVVIKMAPPGLPPVRNRDVLRQGRLMGALSTRPDVVVPRIFFDDAGAPPEVPPIVAMEFVAGECVEPLLTPVEDRPSPAIVRDRYLDAARRLAAVHAVDPTEVGMAGEPVVSLEAEIARWTRAMETVPADLAGNFRECERALLATVPATLPPVFTHGDYRLGNTLCEDGRLTAIIDWEIWSLGDPRIDITWLTYFTDEAGNPGAAPGGPAGTPTRAEVVAEYEKASGVAVPDLPWFDALTRYKEAAATALLIKRARRSGEPLTPAMARMEPSLGRLRTETLDLVGR
jgi:aminoglycoside phosphotransferase (APT) family kinase protein